MKKFVFIIMMVALAQLAQAQIKDPVKWTFEAIKKTADTYEVQITADVEGKWHLYSQTTGKGGPKPTLVSFQPNPLLSLVGAVKETGKTQKSYDDIFKTDVVLISGKVRYTQTVKLKTAAKTSIRGTVSYMVCDDQECLPPAKKSFDIKLQ
ncbi:MAG: hypothetical protein GXC72_06300 [Chitinophagaceae bacterium]|nr:hypothetical protein [Chitinophagaceae bacterium]